MVFQYPTQAEISQYRPKPFYYITTNDPDQLRYADFMDSLGILKSQGYGGIVVFNRPPLGFTREEYLTDPWFAMIENVIRACRDLELKLWINDSYDAPPGDVGRRIEKIAPHLKARRLFLENGTVVVRDVDWGFPAFEEPESSELFIRLVYEAYKERFGQFFGDPIAGFFSDADSRKVNWEVLRENNAMRDYFPWCSIFASSFMDQYGYDIQPYLAQIIRGEAGQPAIDYWQHCSDLYFAWFAKNYAWCRQNGLDYTYHTSDTAPNPITPDNPYSSIFSQGRAPDAYCHCDYPGTDHELLDLNGARLLSNTRDFIFSKASWGGDRARVRPANFFDVYGDLRAKQAESAAFLYDRKGAMCEMYAGVGWGASKTDLRNIAAWQIMQGINFIVPQSYHYRLHGETKCFAPYSFSRYSLNLAEFNRELTENCCLADRGKLEVALAVLDIAEDVWAGRVTDSSAFLSLCKELNRWPQGYVVADVQSILRKAGSFKAIVNPGLELGEQQAKLLAATGLPILDLADLARLDALVPVGIVYRGEGTPHFMRRRLADGSQLVLLANIESPDQIRGELTIDGQTRAVALESGEIAFFADAFQKNGRPDGMPDGMPAGLTAAMAKMATEKYPIPAEVPVEWQQDNRIPLERWIGDDGRPVSKLGPGKACSFLIASTAVQDDIVCKSNEKPSEQLRFIFRTEEELPPLQLWLSEKSLQSVRGIYVDDDAITAYTAERVFDDPYRAYPLDRAAKPGEHTLRLAVTGGLPGCDPIVLSGAFAADVQVENEYYDYCNSSMGIQVYLPELARISLSRRGQSLRTDRSWTEQGHPFYSGLVTYRFAIELPEAQRETVLVLPEVGNDCSVSLDGRPLGTRVWKPYVFSCGQLSGRHSVSITVNNTLGNLFECYRSPSGILGGGYFLRS